MRWTVLEHSEVITTQAATTDGRLCAELGADPVGRAHKGALRHRSRLKEPSVVGAVWGKTQLASNGGRREKKEGGIGVWQHSGSDSVLTRDGRTPYKTTQAKVHSELDP